MTSHDKRWTIERYPVYKDEKLESVSYGCPSLGLMGYSEIHRLVADMQLIIYRYEVLYLGQEEEKPIGYFTNKAGFKVPMWKVKGDKDCQK